MRVLFTTWAWASHLSPLVPLAWALASAGHEVRVASQPGLTAEITRAGLTAVPVGADLDIRPRLAPLSARLAAAGRPIEMPELITRFGAGTVSLYLELAEAMLPDTLAFARRWRPDLVVHEPTTFAGPLVAAALGVPSVRHLWGMDFTYLTSPLEPVALTPLARRLGLSTVDTLGVVSIDPCPPSLQAGFPVRRLHLRYTPYNGAAELPDWLRRPPQRPRICVTAGTVAGRFGGAEPLDARVVAALSEVDAELVVLAPAGELPRRPNLRTAPRIAAHLLLPGCDLVIHSGGGGLAMTALHAGVPQLLLPLNPDHQFNARRLAKAGAARLVHAVHADPGAIRAAAADLLHTPSYRAAARGLRAEMAAQPSARQVVGELTRLAGERTVCHAG
ncbi:DUF1205 domain-containing protein [Crossiella sp. SN42]|uniref:nucleotide disphospho-sugar-binding domain-containing protein n=1 Tax=Crossiella sp. SN42 TaxID=2944808 RepID=UPI00207CD15E|nr:nucleotide disphospho-sugar-binding domain-containing protein [Crossiella sp. SN42]MCO1580337.1 DUF1205 domain-containing protein [Crossiella sp. SN42]